MDFPFAIDFHQFQLFCVLFRLRTEGRRLRTLHFYHSIFSIIGNLFRKNLKITDFDIKSLKFLKLFLNFLLIGNIRIREGFLIITGLKSFEVSCDRI